jgi:hypothetical protein
VPTKTIGRFLSLNNLPVASHGLKMQYVSKRMIVTINLQEWRLNLTMLQKCSLNYPRFATTIMQPWQTARKCNADGQASLSGNKNYMRPGQAHGVPLSILDCNTQNDDFFRGIPRSKQCDMPQAAIQNLSAEFRKK